MLIESVQNPKVKRLRALQGRKGRRESGEFLLEGPKVVAAAAEAGLRITLALVREGEEGLFALAPEAAETHTAPARVIEAVSTAKTPQGIVAAARLPEPRPPERPEGLWLALDEVMDPGNVGTLIRTADAAGAAGVLLSENTADPFSPKVVRSTAGSLFHLPLIRGGMADLVAAFREAGYTAAAGDLRGEDFYAAPPFPARTLLVVGNEARGPREEILALCDRRVKLPMAGRAESLNVAVAGGILLYGVAFGACRPSPSGA